MEEVTANSDSKNRFSVPVNIVTPVEPTDSVDSVKRPEPTSVENESKYSVIVAQNQLNQPPVKVDDAAINQLPNTDSQTNSSLFVGAMIFIPTGLALIFNKKRFRYK